MREFTFATMQVNEKVFNQNHPIEVEMVGALVSEVSELHGCYMVPAVRPVRDAEIEFSF